MKKILLTYFTLLCSIYCFAQDTSSKKAPVVKYLITVDPGMSVKKPPEFPGGNDALEKFLETNLKTPDNAGSVKGRIIVLFIVEKDGSLSHLTIRKSVSPEWDNEALRVLALSPKWQPAQQDGKPVRTSYSIPVNVPAN